MPVDSSAVRKSYPPAVYAVGREKVREYAAAVGETNPIYFDLERARAAGYADLVAPPMFAVVYAGPAMIQVLFDPALDIDFAHLVHGAQDFRWEELVVAGDEISTVVGVKDIVQRRELSFYVLESTSTNQRQQNVCTATWTNIVRSPT